jgi:hypothetical protein
MKISLYRRNDFWREVFRINKNSIGDTYLTLIGFTFKIEGEINV